MGQNSENEREFKTQEIMALPIYPESTTEQRQAVVDAIAAFLA